MKFQNQLDFEGKYLPLIEIALMPLIHFKYSEEFYFCKD